jgi:hypothetical protein
LEVPEFLSTEAWGSELISDKENSEKNTNSKSGEHTRVSSDENEWQAVYDLYRGRHLSYDSRLDSGNEEYELDGFVVEDDEELEEKSRSGEEEVSLLESGVKRSLTRRAEEKPKERNVSIESLESGLFWSDRTPTVASTSTSRCSSIIIAPSPSPSSTSLRKVSIFNSDEPDEIVECINDGIALFSRRCNASRPAMMLTLSKEILGNYNVKCALQDAIRLGLSKRVDMEIEDKECWVIGRPKKCSLSGYIS